MKRKKLLLLTPDFPLPVASGGQAREVNLARAFSKHFDVTLLTLTRSAADRDYIPELESLVHRVVVVTPDNVLSKAHRAYYKALFWLRRLLFADSADRFYNTLPSINRALEREMRSTEYDVLVLMYWFWNWQAYEFKGLKVLDTVDVQSVRNERILELSNNPIEHLLRGRLVRRYREMEKRALRSVDLVVPITRADEESFSQMSDQPLEQILIPAGTDTDFFVPPELQPQTNHSSQTSHQAKPNNNIVFYGALSNPMNVDAVRYLIADVLPALREQNPDVELSLLGSSPTPDMKRAAEQDPGIHLLGFKEDVRPYLQEASVVLLPLRFGYGIRGRVFELMSLGVPMVTTSIAIHGMNLKSGDGLLIEDTLQGIVTATQSVLDNASLRDQLAKRGRQLAVDEFSIAATYERLAEHLHERLEAHSEA